MFRKTSELFSEGQQDPGNRLNSIIRILTWNRNPGIVAHTGWNELSICMYRSTAPESRRSDGRETLTSCSE